MYKKLLLICYFGIITTQAAKCLMTEDNWCIFSKISTTALFTQFFPTAETPNNVEKIKFKSSRLHTYSNKICERFVNLEELKLRSVSLRKINSDAFDPCQALKKVDLSENQLTTIDLNLFKNNENLESINLHGNYLKNLNLSILKGLKNLRFLDLSRNQLQTISVYKSPKLNTLHELWLQNNELSELNEHLIVQKYPDLEKLGLNGNLLNCKRVEDMLELFEEYEIVTNDIEDNNNNRRYTTEKVKGVDCLSETQWSRLPCEKRLAAIRDEWIWLKSQMVTDEEAAEEDE